MQFLRGRWVEVDRDKLKQLFDRFRKLEAAATDGGLPFADACGWWPASREARRSWATRRIPTGRT
ncbi:MAG: hypothetical protein ABSG30_03580 [Steroidobacteraceae bacterium]